MQPGHGEEETTIIRVGVAGYQYQGFQRLWAPPGDGEILQIPGTSDLGGRKRLDDSGEGFSQTREVRRRMTRILIRQGEAPRVSGLFFKSMLQAVLLFG